MTSNVAPKIRLARLLHDEMRTCSGVSFYLCAREWVAPWRRLASRHGSGVSARCRPGRRWMLAPRRHLARYPAGNRRALAPPWAFIFTQLRRNLCPAGAAPISPQDLVFVSNRFNESSLYFFPAFSTIIYCFS